MSTLYDAYDRPIRPKELTRELAAPSLAGVRSIWNSSVASGLTPERLASILLAASEGDHDAYLTLAEEMEERDMHYACELGKRKLAVSRLPVTVEAFSDSAHDKRLADEVRAMVRRPGFKGMIKDALDGLGKGYSAVEIDWDHGTKWMPRAYKWRDPRFFCFDQVTLSELRLRDEADMANGIELTPYKFIVHVPKLKTGIPLRGGLARLASWAWMCKGYTVKDWMAFAEVFGMPLRMGKYRPGTSEDDINILKMAVANLGSDAAAVFPESMMVELVQAANVSGGAQFFLLLADYLDAQVSKGVLGQTASASGTSGKLGDEKLQSEVRDDIRDDDAEQLEETINRDLVRPFIDLNYGPQENYPCLRLAAIESEDVAAISESLAKLVPLGFRVEQSVVRDRLGWPDPGPNVKSEDLLGGPAAAPAVEPAVNRQHSCPTCATARNREGAAEPDTAEQVTEQLSAKGNVLMTMMIEHVRGLLDRSSSLEEFREQLLKQYQALDEAQLGELMGQALMLADLGGRNEVSNER